MGRMSDLWKPDAPEGLPSPTLEVLPEAEPEDFNWFDETGSVPFIEVGGPPETPLRIADVPAILEADPEPIEAGPLLDDSDLPDGLFTIRFRPVVAGMLPGRGYGHELIAYHDPDHPISEQYRLLAGEIALQLSEGPPRVLLLTGAASHAGTTTVALNLAATLARTEAARVTVVDANYRRPCIAERLGLANGPGLMEVLAGRTPLTWAIQTTRQNHLRVLVAGHAAHRLHEAAFPPIIERLRAESDWVIIDAPNWSNAAESVPLADCCDALYVVVRQHDADSASALELQQGFLESTGRLKGCIITQR